eukprot:CAMPEP_0198147648 /NCGR_PEP_ID=MMETSP1443-20131203/36919_1 /TAXON_ID=186043 /ORGANISM="Entomoneis sp., Strain CCMP2396" /LENGTH=450 /DNA_ID=CAMNT_0043812061 /DNA_START=64 /DNA_END=1416 /DNA_ORIENTATION=+
MKVDDMLGRKAKTPTSKTKSSRRKAHSHSSRSKHSDDESTSQMSSLSDSTEEGSSAASEDNTEDLERFERNLRQKHTKACKAMANGVYDVALQEFEAILSDLLSKYGEKHERVGAALHNVAIANLRAGSLDDAMDAIEEAITIRSRSLGRSHPKVADSLVELGIILLSMEEHADSLKVFERALKLRKGEHEEMYSPEDIDDSNLKIAKVINNMGCVNFEQNNLRDAKKNFEDATTLQKGVFRSVFNFSIGYDTSSPGILTMASTMCNMGYVAIEQGDFADAIKIFKTSLQIQQAVLGPGNKLVQSSLDNLGYSMTMMNQYDKAVVVFQEIWDTQKMSSDTTEEKIATLKKLVICCARIEAYEQCFKYLELLEDAQTALEVDSRDAYLTRKLMGEVNYQILKLPSLSDQTNRVVGFALCMGETEEDVDLEEWVIFKPENTSKMSGHRVTHA